MLSNIPSSFNFTSSNWFKILLAQIILLTLVRKDFSFRIQLNGLRQSPQEEHLRQKQVKSKKTILSEGDKVAVSDILSLNPFAGKEVISNEKLFWKTDKTKHQNFIKRFKKVARAEAKKYSIPTAVILANGLLLSRAGGTDIAVQCNNFFAIPCTDDWHGDTQKVNDICYRVYDRAWTSFRDHSLYLVSNTEIMQYYKDDMDYKDWAKTLASVGFISKPEFLIRIIETYRLDDY